MTFELHIGQHQKEKRNNAAVQNQKFQQEYDPGKTRTMDFKLSARELAVLEDRDKILGELR